MAKKIKKQEEAKDIGDFNKEINEIKSFFSKIDKSYINTGIIVLIIILAVWLSLQYYQSYNNFEYNGIGFNRTYFGKILFYEANVPLINQAGQVVRYTQIDFRNDPREIEDIPVNVPQFAFIKNKLVYISYEANKTIEGGLLAAMNLLTFMKTIGLEAKGAIDDSAYFNNTIMPYANCNINPNNTVIMVKEGAENKVNQVSMNCYEIIYKNGEIVKAVERFELAIIEEFVSNFN